jgi:hypothetical protein
MGGGVNPFLAYSLFVFIGAATREEGVAVNAVTPPCQYIAAT